MDNSENNQNPGDEQPPGDELTPVVEDQNQLEDLATPSAQDATDSAEDDETPTATGAASTKHKAKSRTKVKTKRTVQGIARHGKLKRRSRLIPILQFVGLTVIAVMVSAAALGAILVKNLTGDIHTVQLVQSTQVEDLPSIGSIEGGINILIVGSDVREDGSLASELNDVTILLHIAEDKSNAVAISFPRDLIVPIPSCPRGNGSFHSAMTGQPINVTLSYGGLPCTVLTVEALTGLTIPYAAMVTFNGVVNMSNALGGVPVCVQNRIRDRESTLFLDPGTHTLQGWEALAFLRTRKGVGDGSDLGRISMQQSFLSSLVRTVKSDDTLTDMNKLYRLANAAVNNMILSESLASFDTLVSLALTLKDLDTNNISFVTYPGHTGDPNHPGKVIPNKYLANKLFELVKADKPVIPVADNTGVGTTHAEGSATNEQVATIPEGIKGQSALEETCAVGR